MDFSILDCSADELIFLAAIISINVAREYKLKDLPTIASFLSTLSSMIFFESIQRSKGIVSGDGQNASLI